jgi:hypothetical protein
MSRLIKSFTALLLLLGFLLPISVQASVGQTLVGTATPTPTQPKCIPVKQAVAKGLIQLTLTGNGQLFFKSPLHYVVVNLTANPIVICFPVGQINNPVDSGSQSLILPKETILDLGAGQTLEGDLDAFCINEHKHAPSTGLEYHLGPMAKGSLLALAHAIEAQSAQGRLGAQMAIWAITDGTTLNDLNANATPDPNNPSLTDSIRPLLCLAQDDINLGQQLLQTANAGVSLYSGENPLTSYCQSQGIPSISQIVQRLKLLGIEAAVVVVVGSLLCVGVIVGLIILIVRLARRPKSK